MINTVENINNRIIIKGKKTSLLIILILTFVLVISGLIPIAATIFVLSIGIGLHFGLVISYLLFWGGGYYLLRIVLWNTYGQEILTLDNEKIYYVADYKYFKDGRQEIESKNLTTEIIYEDEPNKPVGRLRLMNKNTTIETVLQSNLKELDKIEEKIKTCYNNVYKK